MCVVHMYYVMHKFFFWTWTIIHLGTHDHPMVEGRLREVLDQAKSLVKEETEGYWIDHCVDCK
jgi:hypothetical protein